MMMDPGIEEYLRPVNIINTYELEWTKTSTTSSTTTKKPSQAIDDVYDASGPASDYPDYDWFEGEQIGQWIESIFKKQPPQPPIQTLPANPPVHPVPIHKHRHYAPPEATPYGTRHFLPALVSLVALVCFAMILIGICKVIFGRNKKRKRSTDRTIEEGSKLETFEPSAPPPDETSVQITHVPDTTFNPDDAPPPNYESLFGSGISAAREGPADERPSTSSTNDRYPSERTADESEDSTPSQPLLRSTQPQTAESDNRSESSALRHTQL